MTNFLSHFCISDEHKNNAGIIAIILDYIKKSRTKALFADYGFLRILIKRCGLCSVCLPGNMLQIMGKMNGLGSID